MLTRTYKFRLYPTHSQYSKLHNTLGACRWVYNNMVEKICKEGFQSAFDLNFFLTELKEQNPWLYEHHSKMLQMISTQIYGAEKALVGLAKKGSKTGKLKFAQYSRYTTFVYNQSGFGIKDGSLHLSKIGKISMIQHREIPNNAKIKQIVVSRQAGKWFACITFDLDVVIPKPLFGSVGIDVGIKNFAYDSDSHVTPNPLNLQKMLKPLA
ncbi:MAG: RNA-guided endonuclease InsQ/TnpB family protein, partial [Nitrosotalea sp.]